MLVQLRYFKTTGKYYGSDQYQTTKDHMYEIFQEVRDKHASGDLPGLAPGFGRRSAFTVYVDCPSHPDDHPRLIYGEVE